MMTKAEEMQQMVSEHKKQMLDALIDLTKGISVLAEEVGISCVYVGSMGNAHIHFLGDKFPYEAGEAKRRVLDTDDTNDEMVIKLGDIKLTCYVPKEGR